MVEIDGWVATDELRGFEKVYSLPGWDCVTSCRVDLESNTLTLSEEVNDWECLGYVSIPIPTLLKIIDWYKTQEARVQP